MLQYQWEKTRRLAHWLSKKDMLTTHQQHATQERHTLCTQEPVSYPLRGSARNGPRTGGEDIWCRLGQLSGRASNEISDCIRRLMETIN